MMQPDTVVRVSAREVLNFRGSPALEAEVRLHDGACGRAAVAAGISTGSGEALQVFDGDPRRFSGKGCTRAVEHVKKVIAPALEGMRASKQNELDDRLRELDGTINKGRLGANAILGVSVAAAQAAAASAQLPLFRYLGGDGPFRLPVIAYDVLCGGAHADSVVDFQEYLVIPSGVPTFAQGLEAGVRIYQELREYLRSRGHAIRHFGGPLAVPLSSNREGLEVLATAVTRAGYTLGKEIWLGVDAAASHFYSDGKYRLKSEKRILNVDDMIRLWSELVRAYPIASIEDPLAEDDWDGWKCLTQELGSKVQLVGDDLFTTNPHRIQMGIDQRVANAVLIKPNQIGTLSETLQAITLAKQAGYGAMMSTRSGETEDTAIADLAVLEGVGQFKTGPPNVHSIVKHNRLLRIAEALGEAEYAGPHAFGRYGQAA